MDHGEGKTKGSRPTNNGKSPAKGGKAGGASALEKKLAGLFADDEEEKERERDEKKFASMTGAPPELLQGLAGAALRPKAPTVAVASDGEERDVAVVLLVGQHPELAAHLSNLKHQVTHVDTPDAWASLSKTTFDVVVCDLETWGELSSRLSPFVPMLKKSKIEVAVYAFRSTEGTTVRYQEITKGYKPNLLQESVRRELTIFLLRNALSNAQRSLLAAAKRDDEIEIKNQALKKADDEYKHMSRLLQRTMDNKVDLEDRVSILELENQRLRERLMRRKSGATLGVDPADARREDEELLASTLDECDSSRAVIVAMVMWILSDNKYSFVHSRLKDALEEFNDNSMVEQELEDDLARSDVDPITQSWILYEFSRKQGRPHGKRSTQEAPVDEKPLELAVVKDPAVVDDWGFRSYDHNVEEHLALFVRMVTTLDFLRPFGVPLNNLIRFVRGIAATYKTNPYHTFTHAVDVAQMVYKMLNHESVREYLTELDMFCLMIAAVSHDAGHPGLNNIYQVNDSTSLAMIYNDRSPLENHHASTAFYVASAPECNIFVNMSPVTFAAARRCIIQAILMTDMTSHFEQLGKLSSKDRVFFANRNNESRQLLADQILHMADISNCCRPWEISKVWSDAVLAEFFKQGDLEKSKGLPVSPQMDRDTTHQETMTIGFINFVVRPLANTLCSLLPHVAPMLENLNANYAVWEGNARAAGLIQPKPPEPPAGADGVPTVVARRPSIAPSPRANYLHVVGKRKGMPGRDETESSREMAKLRQEREQKFMGEVRVLETTLQIETEAPSSPGPSPNPVRRNSTRGDTQFLAPPSADAPAGQPQQQQQQSQPATPKSVAPAVSLVVPVAAAPPVPAGKTHDRTAAPAGAAAGDTRPTTPTASERAAVKTGPDSPGAVEEATVAGEAAELSASDGSDASCLSADCVQASIDAVCTETKPGAPYAVQRRGSRSHSMLELAGNKAAAPYPPGISASLPDESPAFPRQLQRRNSETDVPFSQLEKQRSGDFTANPEVLLAAPTLQKSNSGRRGSLQSASLSGLQRSPSGRRLSMTAETIAGGMSLGGANEATEFAAGKGRFGPSVLSATISGFGAAASLENRLKTLKPRAFSPGSVLTGWADSIASLSHRNELRTVASPSMELRPVSAGGGSGMTARSPPLSAHVPPVLASPASDLKELKDLKRGEFPAGSRAGLKTPDAPATKPVMTAKGRTSLANLPVISKNQ